MAIRMLGVFSRNYVTHSIPNAWGRACRASYSTLKKESSPPTNLPTSSTMPTFEEIERDPALRRKIIQQYKELAGCPDFQRITKEVMALGLEGLKKNCK